MTKDDEKAAKKYAGEEPTICSTRALETSDREIWEWTRDAFLAGCQHVRNSAEWKAMCAVLDEVGSVWESMQVGNLPSMKQIFIEYSELDRIRKEGESG